MAKPVLQNQLRYLRTISEETDLGAARKSLTLTYPFNPTTLVLAKGQNPGL